MTGSKTESCEMPIDHFYLQSYEYIKGRHAELLNDAKMARLARLAMESQRTQGNLNSRALSWLGQCLITWGEMLQERFGSKNGATLPSTRYT